MERTSRDHYAESQDLRPRAGTRTLSKESIVRIEQSGEAITHVHSYEYSKRQYPPRYWADAVSLHRPSLTVFLGSIWLSDKGIFPYARAKQIDLSGHRHRMLHKNYCQEARDSPLPLQDGSRLMMPESVEFCQNYRPSSASIL